MYPRTGTLRKSTSSNFQLAVMLRSIDILGMKPLCLLPAFFLLAHAALLNAAETAHDFGKWEKDIARFEQMDRTNPPPKGALLFIGSSTIGRWKTLAQDFPDHKVINRGFGGSEIVDSTHFADRVIFPYEP